MKVIELTQCAFDWQFNPLKDLDPILPAISWKSQLLAGHKTETKLSVNYETQSFSSVFLACHPALSLAELSRLYACTKKHPLFAQIDWPVVVQALGWHWNEHLEKILDFVVETPLEFQHWTSARKFGIRDFSPLSSATATQNLTALFILLAKNNVGYHNGRNLLEWGVELFLLGTSPQEICKSLTENEADWVSRIQSLRFPQSFSTDEKAKKLLKTLPVPPHTAIDWKRQGDLTGIQVEFFAHSHDEMKKKLDRLQHFHSTIGNSTGLPWNN